MNSQFSKYNQQKGFYEILTITGYIILGISFILFLPMGASSNGQSVPVIMIFFLIGGLTSTLARSRFKKLSNAFKTEFLPKEIKKVYPNCHFDVNSGFSKETIYNSKVLKRQDRYYSEDLMEGTYEDVKFRSADVKLQDVRRSGKSTTVVTVFQGRVYEFEFNKRFKSNILVSQPNFFSNFSGKKIETESIKFNNELSVFSEDHHEALYILTPHFMRKLYDLDQKYQDKIVFSFHNNKLYIAINTGQDSFDLKMFRPINRKVIEEFKEQLSDIKEFVHDLNLDQSLFKD